MAKRKPRTKEKKMRRAQQKETELGSRPSVAPGPLFSACTIRTARPRPASITRCPTVLTRDAATSDSAPRRRE